MRRLVTSLLTLIFIAGFCSFFAVQSLVTYARDTDAIVATARAADLRRTGVELVTDVIYQELSGSARLANVPKQQLAVAVREVITEPWVEGAVRDAHAGLVAALDGAGDDAGDRAGFDMKLTKDSLSRAFVLLGEQVRAKCAVILGPGPCVSSDKAKRAMVAYQNGVQAAIRRIPDRVSLLAALEASGQAERVDAIIDVDTLRRQLDDLGALRWVGLATLGLGLVLIALVNWRPPGRTLQATGTALTAAPIAYLLLARLGTWLGPILIEGAGERVRAQYAGATAKILTDGMERMLAELVVRALDMARGVVIVCAIAGVLLLVASRFFPRGE